MSATELIALLGMNRVIRRAYEQATAKNPQGVAEWHCAELQAAQNAKSWRNKQKGQTGGQRY